MNVDFIKIIQRANVHVPNVLLNQCAILFVIHRRHGGFRLKVIWVGQGEEKMGLDGCKGCKVDEIEVYNLTCRLLYYRLSKAYRCPCRTCLVKMMCEEMCVEYMKLVGYVEHNMDILTRNESSRRF